MMASAIINPSSFVILERCPSPYRKVEDKCVYISTSKKSWSDAKKYCEDRGTYLLTFKSKTSSVLFGDYLYSHGNYCVFQIQYKPLKWYQGVRSHSYFCCLLVLITLAM